MRRQHHYKRRVKADVDLDMTTFLNLMVVLVPFLLITAVFSRITIVELSLPSSTGGAEDFEPKFRIEVVVREEAIELGDGHRKITTIPKVDDEYDLVALSEMVLLLKQANPEKRTRKLPSPIRKAVSSLRHGSAARVTTMVVTPPAKVSADTRYQMTRETLPATLGRRSATLGRGRLATDVLVGMQKAKAI